MADLEPTTLESEDETKKFNTNVMLHPYQGKKGMSWGREGRLIEGVSDCKALSFVIKDIGEFVLKNNIEAYFPKVKFEGEDVIVCHSPRKSK